MSRRIKFLLGGSLIVCTLVLSLFLVAHVSTKVEDLTTKLGSATEDNVERKTFVLE